MKILVTEDSAIILKSVSLALRDMGHEVLEEDNGYAARRTLEESADVDILLTDMEMPGIKGDELIEWVRANKPTIKTILMSGHPRVKQFAAQCGADAYIEKSGLGSWTERVTRIFEELE